MHPDQSNTQIVKNYVAMPDKAMFCAKDVAIDTGVKLKTVRNVLPGLQKKGKIKALRQRISGRVYYYIPDEEALKNAKS
ncbi:MAG: hypothetical protein PHC50_04490 [Candidatus Cloacimonetes bacterium]|nr:hypothetical protein [Candidatus Cloacimonadota bacterium]